MKCARLLLLGAAAAVAASTVSVSASDDAKRCFPDDFLFGSATAAYQVEGAWNETGRTPSIWDDFCRERAGVSCANVADDFVHRYKSDIQLMVDSGLDSFRFSISWSRVMNWDPATKKMKPSPVGIAFYHTLIDELKRNNIVPILTLYHWDLPSELHHDLKPQGWLNPEIIDHFVEYAELMFNEFGSKINMWTTFNEPLSFVSAGYATGMSAPGLTGSKTNAYTVSHNVLVSHGKAVQRFRELKKSSVIQDKARIGIVLNAEMAYPLNASDPSDVAASERKMQFELGWFLSPIVTGKYPDVMRERAGNNLPEFTPEESAVVKDSYDLFMLNHYSSKVVTDCASEHSTIKCSDFSLGWEQDVGIDMSRAPKGARLSSKNDLGEYNCKWFTGYPVGYLDNIKWMHAHNPKADILLTENGWCGNDTVDNQDQLWYHQTYLEQVHKAISEFNIPVIGYTAWSFLDNYEWGSFKPRFGLYYVNFTSETGLQSEVTPGASALARIPRPAATWYAQVAKSRCLDGAVVAAAKDATGGDTGMQHMYRPYIISALVICFVGVVPAVAWLVKRHRNARQQGVLSGEATPLVQRSKRSRDDHSRSEEDFHPAPPLSLRPPFSLKKLPRYPGAICTMVATASMWQRLLLLLLLAASTLAVSTASQEVEVATAPATTSANTKRCFPDNFLFGSATAAYQVEGGWNETGRTPSIWDDFCREKPALECANVADDFLHRYKSDIQLMVASGLDTFRFSISWSRMMNWDAKAKKMKPNAPGIAFYHALIDEVRRNNIVPIVTLYHWDLPLELHSELKPQGWLNTDIIAHFAEYAELMFTEFGSKIDFWSTFNEPWTFVTQGYGNGQAAPGLKHSKTYAYTAAHNVLLSHGRAVQVFRELKKSSIIHDKARIGIVLNADFAFPLDPSNPLDVAASARKMDFGLGWFLTPLVSGEYPQIMRERAGDRLPEFTKEEAAIVKDSYDLFMLNHYSSKVVTDCTSEYSKVRCSKQTPGWERDLGIDETRPPPGARLSSKNADGHYNCNWFNGYAPGYLQTIKWMHAQNPQAEILLTENGWCGNETIDNMDQLWYYQTYIGEVHRAISEFKIPIIGYAAWSFVDNYEWGSFKPRFGLYYVNFTSATGSKEGYTPKATDLARIPRIAAKWYAQVAKTKCLDGFEVEGVPAALLPVPQIEAELRDTSSYHDHQSKVTAALFVCFVFAAPALVWFMKSRRPTRRSLRGAHEATPLMRAE